MDVDVRGKIANTTLSRSNGLYPLYEAISNSIHAIDDAQEPNGVITIDVERLDNKPGLFEGEGYTSEPITGFSVTDNGIGFDEGNFKSFRKSDTTRKKKRGGKGLGRFLWLKAFDRVEVESVFGSEGSYTQREFAFRLTMKGVDKVSCKAVNATERKTTVKLQGFKSAYRNHPQCPKASVTIAKRIIEHFLQYFVLGTCPKIWIVDQKEGTQCELNHVFAAEMLIDSAHEDFAVRDREFRISHCRLVVSHELSHSLLYCAHQRAVRSEVLSRALPDLDSALNDPETGRRFIYWGYVTGEILDESVNSDRTRFELDETRYNRLIDDEVSWDEIATVARDAASAYLRPFTLPVRQEKEARIQHFVAAEAPQYKPLLKHKRELVGAIRGNITKEQLDVELYKIGQVWDLELRDEYQQIKRDQPDDGRSHEDFRKRYEKFLEEWNEAGVSKLARYVVHRKATLDFLDERRGHNAENKYYLEDAIHEIIFPLKQTTDDVRMENMNLWIIDERLAYHHYLASDKPLKQVEAVEVNSDDRPDLVIFNRPFAFVESGIPFSSIVIVEFKRPARNDYKEDDEEKNPITQVYEYVRLLKAGKAKDRRGAVVDIPGHLPVYAYIVCDITPKFRTIATNYQLTVTPDQMGYFGYHRELGAYVEVISFDKLIEDAKRKNKILFDKLGLLGEAAGMP